MIFPCHLRTTARYKRAWRMCYELRKLMATHSAKEYVRSIHHVTGGVPGVNGDFCDGNRGSLVVNDTAAIIVRHVRAFHAAVPDAGSTLSVPSSHNVPLFHAQKEVIR